MQIAYLVLTLGLAIMAAMSASLKIKRDPRVVKPIHEIIGVPMRYFPILAALEIAGAVGLIVGIWVRPIGVDAAGGLVLYFIGAVLSHLRVGDIKGIGGALFMLFLSAVALTLRLR